MQYEHIDYEKIIISLENKVSELEFRLKIAENVANCMNKYILDNNLAHRQFVTDVKINNYEDYKRVKTLEIPATSYLVFDDE